VRRLIRIDLDAEYRDAACRIDQASNRIVVFDEVLPPVVV
jgi:hypothetical protein